jgi:hypothetical protein
MFLFFNRQNKLFWYRLEGSHSTHSDNQLVISNSFLFRKVSSKKMKCWNTNSARRVISIVKVSKCYGSIIFARKLSNPEKKNIMKRWKEFQEEWREKGTYYNGSHFRKKKLHTMAINRVSLTRKFPTLLVWNGNFLFSVRWAFYPSPVYINI